MATNSLSNLTAGGKNENNKAGPVQLDFNNFELGKMRRRLTFFAKNGSTRKKLEKLVPTFLQ